MVLLLIKRNNGVKIPQLLMKMIVEIFIAKELVYNYQLFVLSISQWEDVLRL
jgi:hypothetical protein